MKQANHRPPPGGEPDRNHYLDPESVSRVTRWSAQVDISEAVVLVDKSAGVTSHDVVRRLRTLARTRRVGHAGTLDPLATGLLVCLTGRCTRLSGHYLELEKEYLGTLRLGQTTASYDSATPVASEVSPDAVTLEDVQTASREFVGELIQYTPAFSAVRVGGERLYRRARRGDIRPGPPRVVNVYEFEILQKRNAEVDFRVVCSKGTYVRSLAHDMGVKTGVGAHLTALRRTRIGDLRVEDAVKLNELEIAVLRRREQNDHRDAS